MIVRNVCSVVCIVVLACFSRSVAAQDDGVKFGSSNLPVIVIDTHGQSIYDEFKIGADMGIIDNGEGARNDTSDAFNNYQGKIAIEIRGSSSQSFPKKQFSVELRDDLDNDLAASLLGLPEEEDWVLFAPYNDKTLMRDALAYTLGRELGRYAPRVKYCELIFRKTDAHGKAYNSYEGIYVLIEKVKRDKNRVDINKLDPDENTGNDLTGGYILKIDKPSGNSGPGWNSSYPPPNRSQGQLLSFQYEYPEWDEITSQQRQYIQRYIATFEEALAGRYFDDPVNGYAKYIDVDSFVDFFILQEVTRNVDGYRLSTFLHKQRDSDGGKLVMGPVWDFNLAFGNANYCSGWLTSGWMYTFNAECGDDSWLIPFWWNRFLQDYAFRQKVALRWQVLREGVLKTQAIHSHIDSLYNVLNTEAAGRNFERWPVLGQWVWPNYYNGTSFSAEVNWLKQWITKRMSWLDSNMPSVVTGAEDESPVVMLSVHPNPVKDVFSIQYTLRKPGKVRIELVDAMGRTIGEFRKEYAEAGTFEETLEGTGIPAGVFFARVAFNDSPFKIQKLIRK